MSSLVYLIKKHTCCSFQRTHKDEVQPIYVTSMPETSLTPPKNDTISCNKENNNKLPTNSFKSLSASNSRDNLEVEEVHSSLNELPLSPKLLPQKAVSQPIPIPKRPGNIAPYQLAKNRSEENIPQHLQNDILMKRAMWGNSDMKLFRKPNLKR